MNIALSGTIMVHCTGATFRFEYRNGYVYLPGEITISDREHRLAAHTIADALNRTVVWQDISGVKHHVYPDSMLSEMTTIDSRNDNWLRSLVAAEYSK